MPTFWRKPKAYSGRVYYNFSDVGPGFTGLCHSVPVPDADTEYFYTGLVAQLRSISGELRACPTSLEVKCVGGEEGLVYELPVPGGPTLQRTKYVNMSCVIHALMKHLGVEAVINETKPYHPVEIRKVRK